MPESIRPNVHPSPDLSLPLQRVAIVVAIFISLTSSFDIFLMVSAGGNVRFCQMIAPVLILLAIVKIIWRKRLPALGVLPLCVWLSFQSVFIPVTDFWPKSLAYCLWLLLNVALTFSYVQLFGDNASALKIVFRWYMYSFAIIASFGIVQFTLPLFGLPGVLVTQWWIPGSLPRANGFSYEPSYFATYLLMGFVLAASLRRSRHQLLSPRALLSVYWLTASGIVLSSSRLGIVFLVIDVCLAQLRPWISFLGDFRKLRIAPSKVRALAPSVLLICFVALLATAAAMVLERNPAIVLMFLNGTGISDTAAHSVLQREGAFEQTVVVFLDHPFVGRSLGGVSSAIAELNGERIHSFEESKAFEGMSVFAEVLAASGVIGFVPFVWFLTVTIRKPLQIAHAAPPFYSALIRALVRSLIFAWAILQFNQNILRPYLWIHLAILASVYAVARQSVSLPEIRYGRGLAKSHPDQGTL